MVTNWRTTAAVATALSHDLNWIKTSPRFVRQLLAQQDVNPN
jgi:hypothetical protein